MNLLAGEVFNPDAPQGALTSVDLNAYDGGMPCRTDPGEAEGSDEDEDEWGNFIFFIRSFVMIYWPSC